MWGRWPLPGTVTAVATAARDRQVGRSELLDFVRPRHCGILVTTRRDHRPQLSPVAMGLDDSGRIVVSTYPERAKARNARRRPEGSVCVLSDDVDGEWVQVDGGLEVNAASPTGTRSSPERCCYASRSSAGDRSAMAGSRPACSTRSRPERVRTENAAKAPAAAIRTAEVIRAVVSPSRNAP